MMQRSSRQHPTNRFVCAIRVSVSMVVSARAARFSARACIVPWSRVSIWSVLVGS